MPQGRFFLAAVVTAWSVTGACLGASPVRQPEFCPAQVQFSAASRVDLPEWYHYKPSCIGDACIDPARLVNVPAGWAAVIEPRELPLWDAGFSYGPPNDKAQLKPDSDVRRGVRYETSYLEDGTAPHHGYWLDCLYGDGVIHLSRKLPDELKQCTVIYSPRPNEEVPRISMTCK